MLQKGKDASGLAVPRLKLAVSSPNIQSTIESLTTFYNVEVDKILQNT